jgi:beta-glucosidase
MMTGSAIAAPWEAENIPAIVNAWYAGQSSGTAIADVLFGDYNPAGRLPVTFYKSDSDLPDFNDYSINNRTYRYFKGQPQDAFGYGLSYTTFTYEQVKTPVTIGQGQKAMVSARVTNTGKRDGEEVVQLYVAHQNKNIKTPIRALKGFKRIFLKAGESKVVDFTLTPENLSVTDEAGKSKQTEEKILISIGGSQPDESTKASKKTVEKIVAIAKSRVNA